jgi:hypothetical protein
MSADRPRYKHSTSMPRAPIMPCWRRSTMESRTSPRQPKQGNSPGRGLLRERRPSRQVMGYCETGAETTRAAQCGKGRRHARRKAASTQAAAIQAEEAGAERTTEQLGAAGAVNGSHRDCDATLRELGCRPKLSIAYRLRAWQLPVNLAQEKLAPLRALFLSQLVADAAGGFDNNPRAGISKRLAGARDDGLNRVGGHLSTEL